MSNDDVFWAGLIARDYRRDACGFVAGLHICTLYLVPYA